MSSSSSSLALTPTAEPVLATSNGGLIKGKMNVVFGRVELTARAVVFHQRSRLWMMFGLLGALLSMRSRGKRALELELTAISQLARGKYGLNKKILDVTMADGSTHRLMVDKYDDFTAQLRDQLARGARLEPAGDERWTVRPR